MDSRLEGYLKR